MSRHSGIDYALFARLFREVKLEDTNCLAAVRHRS